MNRQSNKITAIYTRIDYPGNSEERTAFEDSRIMLNNPFLPAMKLSALEEDMVKNVPQLTSFGLDLYEQILVYIKK